MMGMPTAWAAVGAVAAMGMMAYALLRGVPRSETRLQKKRRKRREKQKRIERTRTKGLHDLQMLWAVHRSGGEEALKAYVAKRKPSRRYTLAHRAPPDGSALGRIHTR